MISNNEDEWYRKVETELEKLQHRVGVDRKTLDGVFDKSTLNVFGKLFSDRILDTLDFPISTGKEAIVFRAITPEEDFVAVKVYFTTAAVFKHILRYIRGDPRFKSFRNRREVIFEWAKKEYNNLGTMKSLGILAPRPIYRKKNVLVMDYVGTDDYPAPLLKDTPLDKPQDILDTLLDNVEKLYDEAELVHGDLSEYNILMHEGKPYIIDVGQMVITEHPMVLRFLKRDLQNLMRFFKKHGVEFNAASCFKNMTGRKMEDII